MSVLTFSSVSVDFIVINNIEGVETNVCDPCVNVVLQNVVEELCTGLWDSIIVIRLFGDVGGVQDRGRRRFRLMFTVAV